MIRLKSNSLLQTRHRASELVAWLFGRLVDWLIGRLVDWLVGRLVDWIGCWVGWLVGWLIDQGCSEQAQHIKISTSSR